MFFASCAYSSYKVSIITSIYNGDAYIQNFLEDITQQTIFNQCELILINANSPGNEEAIIKKYVDTFPNINYLCLSEDPGLYGVWNMAIKMSKSPYIINANIDDNLKNNAIETFANALDEDKNIDLVYGDFIWTQKVCKTYDDALPFAASRFPEFSQSAMIICLPMNHPMWRKSMHTKYGYFDEKYKSAGDYEMWLRAVKKGSQYKKINEVCGVWYQNPEGLSSQYITHQKEIKEIFKIHKDLLQMSDLTEDQILDKHANASWRSFVFYNK